MATAFPEYVPGQGGAPTPVKPFKDLTGRAIVAPYKILPEGDRLVPWRWWVLPAPPRGRGGAGRTTTEVVLWRESNDGVSEVSLLLCAAQRE